MLYTCDGDAVYGSLILLHRLLHIRIYTDVYIVKDQTQWCNEYL